MESLKKMKKFNTINMIPFIDILLVLLTIILTTSTFIVQGKIKLDLPESKTVTREEIPSALTISVDKSETIYLNHNPVTKNKLEQKLKFTDMETPVLMKIDKSVSFQTFLSVLEIIKKYQLNNLSISARESNT
jgi:biopolymer transport protein ExbD